MKSAKHTKRKGSTEKMKKQSPVVTKQNNFIKTASIVVGIAVLATAAWFYTKDVQADIGNATVQSEDVKDISTVGTGDPGWYKTVSGTGSLNFNSTVPYNDLGNAAFTVGNESSFVELGIYNTFPSVRFDSLYNLTYATYVPARTDKAVTMQVDMDFNVTDSDTSFQGRMVFDPAKNVAFATAGGVYGQPITASAWQTWQGVAPESKWSFTWEGNAATSANLSANPCPASNPCSFGQIMTLFPDAGLNAGSGNPVLLRAGNGWNNLTGYADGLSIVYVHGDTFLETTYNFEPSDTPGGGDPDPDPVPNLPTDEDQCKDDNWKSFDGQFKNQGQCVSYVMHSTKGNDK